MNAYIADEFEKNFTDSAIYNQLQSDYDELVFDKHFYVALDRIGKDSKFIATPRQRYAQPASCTSYFSVVPFYYLDFLTSTNPEKIYDLGCGWNIFKKYIPNIVGIGAESFEDPFFNADIHDYVDESYIAGHQNYFESVFSICALHFIPLSNLRQRVLDFYSMIAPGGRGWLSLNAMRMIELDTDLHNMLLTKRSQDAKNTAHNLIINQLQNLPGKILLLDVDLDLLDNGMDGNIQIIFEKPWSSI